MLNIPRSQWIRALMQHPEEELTRLTKALLPAERLEHALLPQAGIALLPVEDAVFHDLFYIGEIPVAQAQVTLHLFDGRSIKGAARVMSDSVSLAITLAICDAALANQVPGCEPIAKLVETGMAAIEQEERKRGMMLAKTRVDFSLLSQTEGSDED